MYIREIDIKNIRSVTRFHLQFDPSEQAGWHVLIGDNGTGKSTVVRAIALAIIGPKEAPALRENWGAWLRREEAEGHVQLQVDHDSKLDKWTDLPKTPTVGPV